MEPGGKEGGLSKFNRGNQEESENMNGNTSGIGKTGGELPLNTITFEELKKERINRMSILQTNANKPSLKLFKKANMVKRFLHMLL